VTDGGGWVVKASWVAGADATVKTGAGEVSAKSWPSLHEAEFLAATLKVYGPGVLGATADSDTVSDWPGATFWAPWTDGVATSINLVPEAPHPAGEPAEQELGDLISQPAGVVPVTWTSVNPAGTTTCAEPRSWLLRAELVSVRTGVTACPAVAAAGERVAVKSRRLGAADAD
jgi:hypothetical protein